MLKQASELQPTSGFLATASATSGERRIALAVVLLSLLAFAAAVPFARTPLAGLPAFIPAYESALILTDAMTALLLYGQLMRLRSPALLILAIGYLFDAGIIVCHALTFPQVFSPTGLLGANSQTAAWLYVFWHGGFPCCVLAYAGLASWPRTRDFRLADPGRAFLVAAVLAVVAVLLLTLLATAGVDFLTVIIEPHGYNLLVTKGVSPAIWLLTLAALLALWRRRNATVLDTWLAVVMFAWLLDVALSAVIGSARYDLGWYAGRSYGLLAASFVLGVLLLDNNRLYGRLADALEVAEARNVELARSREELSRAQRLEAVGQLTGGVAHDFNNLLTVITGNLELILRKSVDAGTKRAAEIAMRAAERGGTLTHQLLTFARRQVTQPEFFTANQLLTEFEGLLRQAAGEGVEIVSLLDPAIHPVRIDRAQFEAAILNLVVNARDATNGAGRIVIETANIVLDDAYARDTPETTPGSYAMIAISDTGKGMPPDVLSKAFEPFFTTKEVGKGSGLGLSQVYGFAKGAGGHVRLYSELGVGTTVKLYLPRTASDARKPAPRRELPPLRAACGDETILVVEDDEDVLSFRGRRALRARLSRADRDERAGRARTAARRAADRSVVLRCRDAWRHERRAARARSPPHPAGAQSTADLRLHRLRPPARAWAAVEPGVPGQAVSPGRAGQQAAAGHRRLNSSAAPRNQEITDYGDAGRQHRQRDAAAERPRADARDVELRAALLIG